MDKATAEQLKRDDWIWNKDRGEAAWVTNNTIGDFKQIQLSYMGGEAICVELASMEECVQIPPIPGQTKVDEFLEQGYKMTFRAEWCKHKRDGRFFLAADEVSIMASEALSSPVYSYWRWTLDRIDTEPEAAEDRHLSSEDADSMQEECDRLIEAMADSEDEKSDLNEEIRRLKLVSISNELVLSQQTNTLAASETHVIELQHENDELQTKLKSSKKQLETVELALDSVAAATTVAQGIVNS